MTGVVPESQCQVKREAKKARDKDKKEYPNAGSPLQDDKTILLSPVSPTLKDVQGMAHMKVNLAHGNTSLCNLIQDAFLDAFMKFGQLA